MREKMTCIVPMNHTHTQTIGFLRVGTWEAPLKLHAAKVWNVTVVRIRIRRPLAG